MSQYDVDKIIKILIETNIEIKNRWHIHLNTHKGFKQIRNKLKKEHPELKIKYIDRLEKRFCKELRKRNNPFAPYADINKSSFGDFESFQLEAIYEFESQKK